LPPSTQPDPALATAIRSLRVERGLTQEDLAHRAGVTWTTLARIERARSNPTWSTLVAVAGALDLTVSELARSAGR
jgi:transcriptional regulator with XRE-family HTH domain